MLFQRFLDDRSASVVPLLAIAAIPVTALIGASVDYSRASSIRTAMQAAADSTALALSQNAASANAASLSTEGNNYFGALFKSPSELMSNGASSLNVSTAYSTTNGSNVVVTATATYHTRFMGLVMVPTIPLAVTSTAKWGTKRLRVALVLDNTGSMTQGSPVSKISALQTASHNLLNQLQTAAANPGDVYVSIIPFTKDVNVDASNYTQSWIDWTDWDAANGTCSKTKYHNQSTCMSNSGTWTPAPHSSWNGCVTDRTQNYDTMNTTPTTGSTLFPAEQYSVCPTSLVALTYDWTVLNNKIDAMVAAGNTNQPIGLAWGWQSLTPGTPLNTPPEDPNYQYQHIIIILSDGLNTEDRWYTTASSIDNRQRILCDNFKAQNVNPSTPTFTIYTVQVDTDNEPTSSVLQYCAGSQAGVGDSSMFYLLTSPDQIIATFNTIGTQLSKLHLSN